jgi:hypothetical protein
MSIGRFLSRKKREANEHWRFHCPGRQNRNDEKHPSIPHGVCEIGGEHEREPVANCVHAR